MNTEFPFIRCCRAYETSGDLFDVGTNPRPWRADSCYCDAITRRCAGMRLLQQPSTRRRMLAATGATAAALAMRPLVAFASNTKPALVLADGERLAPADAAALPK